MENLFDGERRLRGDATYHAEGVLGEHRDRRGWRVWDKEPVCEECGDRYIYDERGRMGWTCTCLTAIYDAALEDCAAEWRPALVANIWAYAGIPPRFADRTFENFEARDGLQDALTACQHYAEGFDTSTTGGLWLIGAFGTGKTHLAVATARSIIERRLVRVHFVTASGLIAAVQPASGERAFRWQALDAAMEAELLILDDLGQERPTAFSRDLVYRVVAARYEAARPLIVTSNAGDQQLQRRIGGAAVSRLYEMTAPLVIEASDYRARFVAANRKQMMGLVG